MYQYDFIQWLLFFYFYCFVGWCIESTFVSVKKRKLVNRGFMRGPFLPLYGSGAIMMLVISRPFQENLLLVFIAGMVGATVLEYVTGVCMEALFKVRYWDYSNEILNFQGHVCLGSSAAWGVLTIVMTKVIHNPIEHLLFSIPYGIMEVIVVILTILIAIDLTLSFKAALDLRDILAGIEKAREELIHMQKRLDVMIAIGTETKEEITTGLEAKLEEWKENRELRKEEKQHRMEELFNGIEERLESIKAGMQEKAPEKLEGMREEIGELLQKFAIQREKREQFDGSKNFYRRDLIRSNPSMKSTKFKSALEELKEAMNDKKKK